MTFYQRFYDLDWTTLAEHLDREGFAVTPPILDPAECHALASLYDHSEKAFRSRITMERFGYGRGEYQYFAYPLPAKVAALRTLFYRPLAKIANRWALRLGLEREWPDSLDEALELCHRAGQIKPTPLLLRYLAGDYNRLHQDIYGDIHFPIQVIVQLCRPRIDFQGGELVLVEQRPRMQSRPIVVPFPAGCAAIIPVFDRPWPGKRGDVRIHMRHGVSKVTGGMRQTLGLIFHDA